MCGGFMEVACRCGQAWSHELHHFTPAPRWMRKSIAKELPLLLTHRSWCTQGYEPRLCSDVAQLWELLHADAALQSLLKRVAKRNGLSVPGLLSNMALVTDVSAAR
jgi:hypothetical protein